jgi:hypothetical protein
LNELRPSRHYWPIVAGGAACCSFIVATIIALHIDYTIQPDWAPLLSLYGCVIGGIAMLRGAWFLFRLRKSNYPTRDLLAALRITLPSFLVMCLAAASLGFYLTTMGWIKSMLPFAAPFWADQPLRRIDTWLFGNLVISVPGIRFFYAAWQPVHLGSVVLILHWRDGARKNQALISFVVTWAVGMAAAYAVSSAGPIFTGSAPPDEFTRFEASYLLANYRAHGTVIAGGISAFPSMHVAIAAWLALTFRHWVVTLYAVLIAIGAVTMGWHYSMDVLGGAAVAFASWFAVRAMFAERQPLRKAPAETIGSAHDA